MVNTTDSFYGLELQMKFRRRDVLAVSLATPFLGMMGARASNAQTSFEGGGARFLALGSLSDSPSENSFHMVAGLSRDGSIAVGQTELGAVPVAFVWTEERGLQALGSEPSIAWAISADGSEIVGRSETPNAAFSTSWEVDSSQSVVQSLRFATQTFVTKSSDHFGEFNAISRDGRFYAGQSEGQFGNHAFWFDTLNDSLGESMNFHERLAELGEESAYYSVSNGGRVFAGAAFGSDGDTAFSVSNGELSILKKATEIAGPVLPCAVAIGGARETIIVGGSGTNSIPDTLAAMVWRGGDDPEPLGAFPEGDGGGLANAVSADGRIVVGNGSIGSYGNKEWRPFIWDQERGFRNLQSVLSDDFGLAVADWDLRSATAISDDGQTIGGWGFDPNGTPEPWIAVIPR